MIIWTRTDLGLRPSLGPFAMAMVPGSQTFMPGQLRVAKWSRPPRVPVKVGPIHELEVANRRLATVAPGTRTALELVRTGWLAPREARLVKIATTLVAQPLDRLGIAVGSPIDVSCFADPFNNPIPHPVDGEARSLFVRWYLILDTDRLGHGLPLLTVPEHEIPRGVGIVEFPDNWADFRFAWQSRYGENHRADATPDGFIRLFAMLFSPGVPGVPAWSVRVGGLVTLHLQKEN